MISGVLSCVVALIGLGALAAFMGRSVLTRPAVYGACCVACVATAGLAAGSLMTTGAELALPLGLPWVGAHFRLDPLADFFLLVVDLGGAAASLYAIGYGRHESEPRRVLPFVPAFIAGMNLVVIAADAYTFLFAWELMSLTSWALVVAHHRSQDNMRSGYVYLVMASFGTLALLLAFGLLAGPDGGYAFAVIRAGQHAPVRAALVLALVLLGAGSKAGLVPLHVWLPLAHPAAPSHVSALMSGVMTKVAVYAFVRIVFDLLGPPAWWWSVPVVTIGAVTAAMGVLYALMERDLKKILAYSTIENIGIIFLGLGLSLAFQGNGLRAAAALAVTAAFFHVFNHMLFKSVLFFGAGTISVATGELNIERLGGLIGRMPYSAGAVLMACMAISALPPFNGFVSEWLTFQTILISPQLPQWSLKLLIPAAGALLALSAALAAACFVRVFGITYLGRPRSAAAGQAREADGWSLGVMFGLAGLCLAAGLLPGLVIDALGPVVLSVTGGRMPPQLGLRWLSIVPVAHRNSSYDGLLVFLFVAAASALAAAGIHRFASRAARRAPAWDCGYPNLGPLTQYSAASLAQPLRRVFGPLVFGTHETVEMPLPGETGPARIRKFRHDPVWAALYAPVVGVTGWASGLMNHMQFLTIRRYLSLVFVALVVLLLLLPLWS
jgi:hydrogenase-4 component B